MTSTIKLGTNRRGVPVVLPNSARTQGTYVIGLQGTGKSTLLANMIRQDIASGHGVCVLDPKGELIEDILASLPHEHADRVVYLDAGDPDYAFGLNLFECRDPADVLAVSATESRVVQTFKKVYSVGRDRAWGYLLEDLLRNVAYVAIANQPFTMTEVGRLLTDKQYRERLVARLDNDDARDFWAHDYPTLEREQRQYRSSTMNKVRAFTGKETVRTIVGQTATTIDFVDIVENGKILLVDLALDDLKDMTAVSLLGTMIVGMIHEVIFSDFRRQELFCLYCDEYALFATPHFEEFFAQGRSAGICVTVAHQWRSQLEEDNRTAPKSAANLVVYNVVGEDARELAAEFDSTPPPPELTGEKLVLEPSRDPWRDLKRHVHHNPTVVSAYLTLTDMLKAYEEFCLRVAKTRPHRLTDNAAPEPEDLREVAGLMEDLDENISRFFIENITLTTREAVETAEIRLYARLKSQAPPAEYSTLTIKEFMEERSWHYERMIEQVRKLRFLLQRDPLQVTGTTTEPIYAHTRTRVDMQNETAGELATLPQYWARYRIRTAQGDEEGLLTSPPGATHTNLTVDAIRELSRSTYCRPRSEVEAEIRARRERLEQEPNEPEPVQEEVRGLRIRD